MGVKGQSKLRGLTVDEARLASRLIGEVRSGRSLGEFTSHELSLMKVSTQSQVERHQDGQAYAIRLLGKLVRHDRLVTDKKQGRAAGR